MPKKPRKKRLKPLSLYPLTFDEVMKRVIEAGPMPKRNKKPKKAETY
jgi:hypothetical protein